MSDESKPAASGGARSGASGSGTTRNGQPESRDQDDAAVSSGSGSEAAVEGEPRPASAEDAGAGEKRGSDGEEESLLEQLEQARAEAAEHKDRYLRAAAEAENVRRRADHDVAGARKYAIEGFATEILAVRDSLEIARALEISEDDGGAVAKMKEGLDLTLKQLDSALAKFSIDVVDPRQGEKLDPDRHQAMTTQESDNVPPNHILSVIQKGYTIHDRLLRPAMVVVAKKPQDEVHGENETA